MKTPDDMLGAARQPAEGPALSAFLSTDNVSPEQQLAILRLVVDSVPDAIIVHDSGGHVAFFNEGACEFLGYSREEMAGLGPFGWVAPEAATGGAGRLERILREGQLGFSSAARHKDGSTTPTDVLSRRVDTPGGPLIVSVIRDVRERAEAQRELEFLAYHDPLTGLWNRTAFEERLRLAIADTRRHGDVLGLAYIDLDRFKPINDEYGHHEGDVVLITLGGRMVASVREQDMVVRLGGDEFVILLPRMVSSSEFEQVADRLLSAIREPIAIGNTTCSITATIGFALFDHEHDDARTLLVKSDVAMYRAKRDPAHPWLEWTPEMGLSVS